MTDVAEDTEQLAPGLDEEFASFEDLLAKPVAHDEFKVEFPDGKTRKFRFEAIDGPAFDKLMAMCPPTTAQRAQGASYDSMKFSALLLSRVSVQPRLSPDQWKQIINAPNWSGGEAGQLFTRAMDLCMKQLQLGPTSAG